MPRKAKTKMRSVPQRAAQTLVTPFVGFGDVLALVDFETWKTGKRKRYRALLYAVFAALAACARVKPFTAATFLLADYEANRLEALNNVRDRRYPVVLLAAAVEVIEAYLKERRDLGIGGEHLLVDENGAPLVYSRIYLAFDQLSERCGHFGGKIVERLIEFHDLQLEKERKRRKPDLAACVALRHGRRGPLDKWQARAEIYAAAGDRARMLDVLDRNHDLGGASGKSVGGHGRAKALETGRLFSPPKLARRLTPGIRNDKVCARLLDFDWPKGKEAQVDERRNIVKADMPHLVWLLDEHKINRSDLRRILNCSMGTVRRHELVHRRSLESEDERRERERVEADWRDKAPALYLARPLGEPFPDFHARIAAEEKYPFGRAVLSATLKYAGVLPYQVARRQKKKHVGIKRKVQIRGVTVKEMGVHEDGKQRSEGYEGAPERSQDTENTQFRHNSIVLED